MNEKLLNTFIEISDNLKDYIDDHELYMYTTTYSSNDDVDEAFENLVALIKKNSFNQYFCVTYDEGENEIFFGDKQTVEEKLDSMQLSNVRFEAKECYAFVYNLVEDKEAFIKTKVSIDG